MLLVFTFNFSVFDPIEQPFNLSNQCLVSCELPCSWKGWLVCVGAKSTWKSRIALPRLLKLVHLLLPTLCCHTHLSLDWSSQCPYLTCCDEEHLEGSQILSGALKEGESPWGIAGLEAHQKRGRLLSEMLSSTALLALHATLPRSSWSWMDSLLLFNSAVLLGSDGWGTVGQSHGWESHSPPSPLPGKFCELPRCFLKQGRKEDSNFSF